MLKVDLARFGANKWNFGGLCCPYFCWLPVTCDWAVLQNQHTTGGLLQNWYPTEGLLPNGHPTKGMFLTPRQVRG